MFFDRGNVYEFLSLGQELAAPGELQHPQTFPFNFKNVEKQYESYNGINVKLRYFVRVTVSRRMADVIREKDIWVYSYRIPPETNSSIKMDVGIEDCLHIEFEYSKSKYHLKDVIVGRIYFLLVRLKIKHMELSIIRRETTGVAPNQYNESETLVRFEVFMSRDRCMSGERNADMAIDNGRIAIKRYSYQYPRSPFTCFMDIAILPLPGPQLAHIPSPEPRSTDSICRRDHTHPALSWRVRSDSHVP